jgi:D-3-phosphoglycerate dehydrogenase / 2-oxoglutarate reductase
LIPVQRSPDPSARVLLLERIHSAAAERFRKAGYHVDEVASSLSEDELMVRLQGVTILGIRSKTQLTRRVLESTSGLTAIGAFCIGTNQIDLKACSERGVAVFNAPFANTRSVVEMALGEMILLIRDIPRKNTLLHQGAWEKSSPGARELRGKRLGIVGYGNIGAQLSVLAEGLGMEVHYYDIAEKLALGNARVCRSLDELLEVSDVVTVHVDGSPGNEGIIGAHELARMKPGAVLINLSRGFVVDLEALRSVLESGHLKGAAIDVFPTEPKEDGSTFESPLRGLPNVILTPHIGGSTQEAQESIGAFVPEKLLDFLEKGTTTLSVNFPNLQLPEFRESHRLVHVHRNEPGILARLNRTMAERGLNITGQYLKTSEDIGYVITDIGRDYDEEVVSELHQIPGTIRVRVLY